MNDWAKTKSFSVIWKASNAKRFDLHKFWMNTQSLWSLTWQTFIWYEAKQICLCLNLTIKIQYTCRLTILKYKDWLVKSASKKKKKMKTVLQTQQLKNHDDFCALNQDLPTIRPINYQKSCSIKTFLSSQCFLPKSASNQIYFSLTFGIYTSSSSSRLSIAQTCVLKYHPKHADSTKKLSSYSVLVLSYSWHCQICCHVWINIQNGYN